MSATDEIFKKTLHAWFSQKQYDISRAKVAKKVNKEKRKESDAYIYRSCKTGENIEVTEVSKTAEYSSNWDDVKYLGEVDKCIKTNYN
mgnify:FL=1